MDTQEILKRAADYLGKHGSEDESDESRHLGKIRHLKGLVERHLSAMKYSNPVERELLGSEIDSSCIELEKLLS